MVQLVAEDRVVFAKERFEQARIRVKTRRVEDRIVLAEEAGDGGFKLLVQVLRAADKANRGETVAVMAQPFLSRLDNGRMVREAEVIICAEVDDLAAADANGGALGALQLPLALVKAFRSEIFESALQFAAERNVAHRRLRAGF